jgi:anti-sigma regulatory factor (Ser/Thr protein kinase)
MAVGSDACTVTGHTVRRMSFIELAPRPEAVPCARRLAAAWDLAGLTDDAQLIVSELVTNAVTASAALPDRPPVSLRLITDGRSLRIEVQDHSPLDLRPDAEASDDAEHGRGLGVVAGLSTRCGSERTNPSRKTVWAELRITPHETSYLGVNVDRAS